MKKTLLSVAIATLSLSSYVLAAEAETGYVGVRSGWSHVETHSGRNAETVFTDDRNSVGYGLYTGYNFSEFFGLEMGYDYFGKFANKGSFANVSSLDDYKVHGFDAAALVALPFNSLGDDLFVKFGALYSNVKDSAFDSTASKVSPLLGVGARYAIGDFLVRLEYDWAHKIASSDDFGYSPDLTYLTLGLEYKFGGKEPVKEVAPAPTPVVKEEIVEKQITIDAATLFGFDKNQLSEEGKQSISAATREIQKENLQNVTIKVDGHTDRLGSDEYNMKLSKARARSVVEEFVSNGVEPSKITAEGFGESQPVTGDACNNIKNRKKLIECLAPDRRVEIKFNGVKTYTK